jgi:hypothetical protein
MSPILLKEEKKERRKIFMFEFNGKEIKLEFDYNTMCELEDLGFSMEDAEKKPMSFLRMLLYIALKKIDKTITQEKTGEEIKMFLQNGGSMETISEAITNGLEDSGFFPKNNK